MINPRPPVNSVIRYKLEEYKTELTFKVRHVEENDAAVESIKKMGRAGLERQDETDVLAQLAQIPSLMIQE